MTTTNDSRRTLVASIIKQNIAALAAAMKKSGLEKIELEYRGSGDSGDDHEHNYEVPDCLVPWRSVLRKYDKNLLDWVEVDETTEVHFDTAAEEVLEELIDYQGHSGYENNEGGGGCLRVRADGTFEYEHYWYEVKESYAPMYSGEDLPALATNVDANAGG